LSIKFFPNFKKILYNNFMDTIKSDSEKYTIKDFGEALLELKEDSGLSYMQIAVKAGLSDTYLINIVKGKNLAPNDENIEKIASAFGLKPEYFKEYRNRRLSEKLNTLNFDKENYDVPLSQEEVQFLQKVIDRAKKEFKK